MKLLLDEDLDVKLRYRFGSAYDVVTVRQMDWLGRKNGELLALLREAGFGALITDNKNMRINKTGNATHYQ